MNALAFVIQSEFSTQQKKPLLGDMYESIY